MYDVHAEKFVKIINVSNTKHEDFFWFIGVLTGEKETGNKDGSCKRRNSKRSKT